LGIPSPLIIPTHLCGLQFQERHTVKNKNRSAGVTAWLSCGPIGAWIVLAVFCALPPTVSSAWAQTTDDTDSWCHRDCRKDPECVTTYIASGRETPALLSDIYFSSGLNCEAVGRYDQAIADYNKAIALNPNSAFPYDGRAWINHERGADAEALLDAEKAVSLAPTNAAIIRNRGLIYEKLGQRDKAIADYNAALKLYPGTEDAVAGLKRLGVTP
jgi:tetratricopeptide (TPR) repeat protein